MAEKKESRTIYGLFIFFCIAFLIAGIVKGDWFTAVLFGLFAFLNVSQYFKPAPEKPYKAEVSKVGNLDV